MRTISCLSVLLFCSGLVSAQKIDFVWTPDPEVGFGINPIWPRPNPPAYWPGRHSGARSVAGPFDFDNDGKADVVLTDYSGGGRVHIIENIGVDQWELVFSSQLVDSSSTTGNARGVTMGDLDGDGLMEVYVFLGHGYSTLFGASFYQPGLYYMEATGEDDELGILLYKYQFGAITGSGRIPDRFRTEQMTVVDVDGDGGE